MQNGLWPCAPFSLSAFQRFSISALTSWRRGWDSNPRDLAALRFSRPTRSTTLPPLQVTYCLNHVALVIASRDAWTLCCGIQAPLHRPNKTTQWVACPTSGLGNRWSGAGTLRADHDALQAFVMILGKVPASTQPEWLFGNRAKPSRKRRPVIPAQRAKKGLSHSSGKNAAPVILQAEQAMPNMGNPKNVHEHAERK